jgi:hypothetical protein
MLAPYAGLLYTMARQTSYGGVYGFVAHFYGHLPGTYGAETDPLGSISEISSCGCGTERNAPGTGRNAGYQPAQNLKKLLYLITRSSPMSQTQTMTLHEKLELGVKAIELKKQGKLEEAKKYDNKYPCRPIWQNLPKNISARIF